MIRITKLSNQEIFSAARITVIAMMRVYLRLVEGMGGFAEPSVVDGAETAGCGIVCCCES
jgi:hypothetical protein